MINKITASGEQPKTEDIESPPEKLEGPELLREQIRENPTMNVTYHFNDADVTSLDLIDEIIELRAYNKRAFEIIQRMGDPYAVDAEVDSSGTSVEVRSRLTVILAETLGSYLRHPDAKNFVTMELTSPDEKVGTFEVTVRRMNGETPAEQLNRIKAENSRLNEELDHMAAELNAYKETGLE